MDISEDISDRHAHLRPAVARADGGDDRDAFSTSSAEATTLLATSERRLSLLGIAGCDPAHTTGNRGRWHRERPDLSTTHHDR
jgi:hypothetical protein